MRSYIALAGSQREKYRSTTMERKSIGLYIQSSEVECQSHNPSAAFCRLLQQAITQLDQLAERNTSAATAGDGPWAAIVQTVPLTATVVPPINVSTPHFRASRYFHAHPVLNLLASSLLARRHACGSTCHSVPLGSQQNACQLHIPSSYTPFMFFMQLSTPIS